MDNRRFLVVAETIKDGRPEQRGLGSGSIGFPQGALLQNES